MTELQRMKLIQEEHDARQHTVGASDGFRGNQYSKVVSGQIGQLALDEPEIVRNGKPGKEIPHAPQSQKNTASPKKLFAPLWK